MGFIFVYAIFVIGRFHPVLCRLPLSLSIFVCFWMTLLMSIGLTGYSGMKFSGGTAALSFLLGVIVILDCTFLVRSIEMVPQPHDELPDAAKRFQQGFEYAAVSMFKSSSVGILAFGFGAMTPFPAIRSFCITGLLIVAFNLWNILSFFAGCLYYDSKRQAEHRKDCCGACRCDPEGWFFCKGCCTLDDYAQKKMPFFEAFLLRRVVPILLNNFVRAAVILLYLGVSAVGIAGIIKVEQKLDVDWLVRNKPSSIEDAIDVRDDYFDDRGYIVGFYMNDADFSSEETQAQILDFADAVRDCEGCDEQWMEEGTVFSFLESFAAWVKDGQCFSEPNDRYVYLNFDGTIPTEDYYTCLNKWIETPMASFFLNDLVFTDGVLSRCRFTARIEHIYSSKDGIQVDEDLNDIADDFGPGDSYPFNTNFLYYAQFKALPREPFIFLGKVLAATFVVMLTFNVFPLVVLLQLVNIVAIVLSLFATMWVVGVDFNVVSVLHIFMCAILAAQLSAHITHVFITQEGTRRQRLGAVFRYIGGSLPHVAFSAVAAIVLFFPFTLTYIFQVFGIMWGGFLIFTFTHCFFGLPVLLSIFGPHSINSFEAAQVDDEDLININTKNVAYADEAEGAKFEATRYDAPVVNELELAQVPNKSSGTLSS
jgi:Niemann-Pick C1-like protein 1